MFTLNQKLGSCSDGVSFYGKEAARIVYNHGSFICDFFPSETPRKGYRGGGNAGEAELL